MIIYVIIGIALFSISYKSVKSLDNGGKNKEENNTGNATIKDGMNLYFGTVLGKLIILGIGLIIIILIPFLVSFFMAF